MTRSFAKEIALLIVRRWWERNCPTTGSFSGYRIVGANTGRINRNGDLFPQAVWDRAWAEFAARQPNAIELAHDPLQG